MPEASDPQNPCTTATAPGAQVANNGLLTGQATKLRSYPHKFHKVIECAKLIAQCECTTNNPFSAWSMFLDQTCAEFFNEALLKCENVPLGRSLSFPDQITDRRLQGTGPITVKNLAS